MCSFRVILRFREGHYNFEAETKSKLGLDIGCISTSLAGLVRNDNIFWRVMRFSDGV